MPGKKLYRGNEDKVIDQKHLINTKLVEIMEYRQSRKWYASIIVVGLFSFICTLMIFFFKVKMLLRLERNFIIDVRWICRFVC